MRMSDFTFPAQFMGLVAFAAETQAIVMDALSKYLIPSRHLARAKTLPVAQEEEKERTGASPRHSIDSEVSRKPGTSGLRPPEISYTPAGDHTSEKETV